jgi:nucleotide-binding universal stress UspA family protein
MERRIVVGVDGSTQSVAALRWAAEEARLRGATLNVITVWEFPQAAYMSSPGWMMPADLGKELERRAMDVQDAALRDIQPEEGSDPCEARVVEGVPAEVLIEASKGADLLVLGSRGSGGFRGLLLGSIGQQCSQHARCPVVIVRAAHEEENEVKAA